MSDQISNEDLVKKGIITADALVAAGKLNPKQADRFIDFVIDVTALKGFVRTARFTEETMLIEKIGVGTRVAMPAALATDPGRRRGVDTSKISLTPKEIILPFEIGDQFKELNIEGADIEEKVIRLMSIQLGNDLQELYVNGDLLGAAVIENDIYPPGSTTQYIKDDYLALFDGWLRAADNGAIIDATGDDISSAIFSRMIKAMPDKFKRTRRDMVFLVPSDIEQNYREKVATRATDSGDRALSTMQNLTPFGVELMPVPLLPTNPKIVEHVTVNTDGTTATALKYAPISNVIVTNSDIGLTPVTPFILDTDYSQDLVNGTITRLGGGSIGSGATVKVTYSAGPQGLLVPKSNLILAIGRDIRIERDRDIFRRLNQFVVTLKADAKIEEDTAVVKVINLGEN